MGEVWRGRDTRLDRSVAIKILPAELAEDAQFKLRFEREARAISQLALAGGFFGASVLHVFQTRRHNFD